MKAAYGKFRDLMRLSSVYRVGNSFSGSVLLLCFMVLCVGVNSAQGQNFIPLYSDNFTNIRNNLGGHYRLAENISFRTSRWIPFSGTFTGSLDGNGFNFSSAIIWKTSSPASVFSDVHDASFSNLVFLDVDIIGSPATLLAQSVTGITNFTDIYVSGEIHANPHSDATGLYFRDDGRRDNEILVKNFVMDANIIGGHAGLDYQAGDAAGVFHAHKNSGRHNNSTSIVRVEESLIKGLVQGGEVGGIMHGDAYGLFNWSAGQAATGGEGIVEINRVLVTSSIRGKRTSGLFSSTYGGGVIDIKDALIAGPIHSMFGVDSEASGLFWGCFDQQVGRTKCKINDVLVTAPITSGGHDASGLFRYSSGETSVNRTLITGVIDGLVSSNGLFDTFSNRNGHSITLINALWDSETTGVPGGNSTNTLQMPSTYDGWTGWRTAPGKYPFPEALDELYLKARIDDQNPINCNQYACPETTTSLTALPCAGITCSSQKRGSLDYLMYDGHRYHGIVKEGTPEQGAYWFMEQDGQRLSFPCCDIYDFINLSSPGAVIDAAVYHDGQFFVAYHPPEMSGQIEPSNSFLAMFTVVENQIETGFSMQPLPYRVVSLFDADTEFFINSGQKIYRSSSPEEPELSVALEASETIQSADCRDGVCYLLTHQPGEGYRIRTVSGSVNINTVVNVVTPSGVTVSRQAIATLMISRGRLHLLMIDNGSVIWKEYDLVALGNTAEEAKESEAMATLPHDITPAAITLLPEHEQQVFILGQSNGQPKYSRMSQADFVSVNNNNEWPLWRTVALGVGSGVAGIVGLGTLLAITKCAYNYCTHPDKGDSTDRAAKQSRKRQQRSQVDRTASVELPMDARNPMAFRPDGGSVINADPVVMTHYEQVAPAAYEQFVPQDHAPSQSVTVSVETPMDAGHQHDTVNPGTGEVVYDYATVPVPQGNLHQQSSHSQADPTYAQVNPDHVRRKKEQRRKKQQSSNGATETESTPASNPAPPAQRAEYHQLSEIYTGASNSLLPSSQESGYMLPADAINPPPPLQRETQRRTQNPITRPADDVYSEAANPARYHQQPEQGPDTLDGAPLKPEEPAYMNR